MATLGADPRVEIRVELQQPLGAGGNWRGRVVDMSGSTLLDLFGPYEIVAPPLRDWLSGWIQDRSVA